MIKRNNSFKSSSKKKSPYYEGESVSSKKSLSKDNWRKYGKNILKNYNLMDNY